MTCAIEILSQNIEAVTTHNWFDVQIAIVHKMNVLYDDGRTRSEDETIIEFKSKFFSTEEEAKKWMQKDKLFKATLKSVLKYTPLKQMSNKNYDTRRQA